MSEQPSLREFIKLTVRDVLQGVSDASLEASKLGAEVNPMPHANATTEISGYQRINFDISVFVDSSKAADGGFRVSVLGVEGSIDGKTSSLRTQHQNRISFMVPVRYPTKKPDETLGTSKLESSF